MMKQINSLRHCTLCKFLKKMASAIAILSLLFLGHTTDLKAQMASCYSKFVGNIWYNGTMPLHYDQYFNQLTPENATKWASVQGGDSNSWNWGDATSMYNYCKSHGNPFKFHTLVWGNQYPSWVDNTSNKAAAVENWIREAGRTFPNCDFVDVVNECLPNHAQPSWLGSIGGTNGLYGTGWDWVVWSFEKARQYFPNSKLLINDYNILNNSWNNDLDVLCQIVNILKSRGLIDGIGLQSHGLAGTPGADVTSRLNRITSQCPGVSIYISEFDLDIADDNQQKNKMAELFPIFWNNSSVKGITFWGYVQGHTWIPNSYLIRSDGSERPAMVWLKDYLSCNSCSPTAITPYLQVNDGTWQQTSSVTVNSGDKVKFGPQPGSGGSWSWNGGGTSGTSREQTIYPTNSITATATYTNSSGCNSTQNFTLTVSVSNSGNVMIQNKATTLYIDGMGRSSNGDNAGQWGYSGTSNQQWTMETSGSNVRFKNVATSLYLDGMGRSSDGSLAGQWGNGSSPNQQWTIETYGSFNRIKNVATGLYLDGMGWSTNGSDLGQYGSSGSDAQQWTITNLKSAVANSEELSKVDAGKNDVLLFPNPFTDETSLKIDNPAQVTSIVVLDMLGRQVEVIDHATVKNLQTIGSSLKSGMYVVQVCSAGKTQSFKVFKK